MKKTTLAVGVVLTISTMANAQTRHCGTMENLEWRKQEDPTLEKRMTDDERKIQEWMKQHPKETTPAIVFPSLNNFKSTGNTDTDRISYAKVKQEFVATNGVIVPHVKMDEQHLAAMREEKAKRYHAIH